MSRTDLRACAPPEELEEFGVTEGNADLLNLSPEYKEVIQKRKAQLAASEVIEKAGGMSRDDFVMFARELAKLAGIDDG